MIPLAGTLAQLQRDLRNQVQEREGDEKNEGEKLQCVSETPTVQGPTVHRKGDHFFQAHTGPLGTLFKCRLCNMGCQYCRVTSKTNMRVEKVEDHKPKTWWNVP